MTPSFTDHGPRLALPASSEAAGQCPDATPPAASRDYNSAPIHSFRFGIWSNYFPGRRRAPLQPNFGFARSRWQDVEPHSPCFHSTNGCRRGNAGTCPNSRFLICASAFLQNAQRCSSLRLAAVLRLPFFCEEVRLGGVGLGDRSAPHDRLG
jgi:hypothetical protein